MAGSASSPSERIAMATAPSNHECLVKCTKIFYHWLLCEGDVVMVKAGREVFSGRITRVSEIAVELDDGTTVKLSKIYWVKYLERSECHDL